MKIAIDISPLRTGHFLQHRVRGTGFYIENLIRSLKDNFPKNQYVLFKRGEKLPGDVSVIHNTYFEPFFLTVPFKNLSKTVVTVHDLIPMVFPNEFPPGMKGMLRWNIQKFLLRKVAAIITDSKSSKKDILKYVRIDDSKVHVVYLAAGKEFTVLANKREIKDSLKKKYNLPDIFALYVGDATWNKNLPRLIEATTEINVPLVMVGKALIEKTFDRHNPWNRDLAKIEKQSSVNKNILRLGFIPSSDLVRLYNIATVFIMPSLYEGFGLPVLEAMSCGCPVIISDKGSLKEVAGDAAFYVNPEAANSISNAIKMVLGNVKLQSELSTKGLEQAKKFNWKKTAEQTVEVYRGL